MESVPQSQLPPQQAERITLFNQIRKLREKTSKQTKIIVLLILVMLLVLVGFTLYSHYLRSSNPINKLTFDIPKDIINKPVLSSNKVENRLIDNKLAASYTIAQIDKISSNLYPSYSNQSAKFAEDEFTIHFLSTDEKGEPLTIKAQVFVPKGSPSQKFPLFVFGQGTTGIGDQCAPSLERPEVSNWGNYYNHLRTRSEE